MSDEPLSAEPYESAAHERRERTTLGFVLDNILDEPSAGLSAWARTTAGVVALLLSLQLVTGVLLSFYYVPSAESAHSTVAYVEKVLGGGSWLRALHLYGSQLLPLALALHLAQMLWRGAYARRPVGWVACVLLLGLVTANGATGYSLPWDARAFFSTRVAENVTGGLPLVGDTARAWLVGGAEISTLTLSRFFALHALVVPALLLAVVVARLFVFREPQPARAQGERQAEASTAFKRGHPAAREREWAVAQLARNATVAALVFAALAAYALNYPAPLGPAAESAPPGYLPRPGAQFLWLFQLLKYFPRAVASLVAFFAPAILLSALALLPFKRPRRKAGADLRMGDAGLNSRRKLGLAIFAVAALVVVSMTATAYLEDSRDPRVRVQLAKQAEAEAEFRRAPFVPRRVNLSEPEARAGTAPPSSSDAAPPPDAYGRHCAKCHGASGEGKSIYPPLTGITRQPRRTLEDVIAIINDPASYGLDKRMPSFARKLSDEEKRAVAEWIVSLQ